MQEIDVINQTHQIVMYVPFYDGLIFGGCKSPFFRENYKIVGETWVSVGRRPNWHVMTADKFTHIPLGRLVLAKDWFPTSLGPDASREGGGF